MNYQELVKLGLTENEAKVYLAFLSSGKAVAAGVARELNMDKSSCYRAVESLESEGLLVKYPKKRGTTYEAANPLVLKELLKKRQDELKRQGEGLDEFIKNFAKGAKESRDTYITMQKGYGAHIEAMEKSLEDNHEKLIREIWDLNNPIFNEEKYSEYIDGFIKRRLAKGIRVKYIARFREDKKYSRHMIPTEKYLKEIRLMPEGFTNASGFRVWSNMIEIVSFDENGDHVVITAQDKFLVELIKNMFDFIWERSEVYNLPNQK